jgi:type VII secretion protein EccE
MADAAGAARPPGDRAADRTAAAPAPARPVGDRAGGDHRRRLWARAVEHGGGRHPDPVPAAPPAAPTTSRPRSTQEVDLRWAAPTAPPAPSAAARTGAWSATASPSTTAPATPIGTAGRTAGQGEARSAAAARSRTAAGTAAGHGAAPGRPAATRAVRQRRAPRPAFPRREHRLAWLLGEVSVGQILCCQLAVVAVALVRGRGPLVTFVVVTAATAVVLAATVRVRGMWLFQWLDRYGQFTARVGRQRGAPAAGPALALLSPHSTVESVVIDGVPAAVVHHPGGVTAVLAPHTPAGPHDDGATLATLNLSSPAPLLPAAGPDSPAYSVQLVLQADPVGRDTDWSRRALPRQQTWIALQALRTADSYRDEELLAALTNAVRRLLRRLARDELPTRMLDRAEVLALLSGLARVRAGEPAREGWRSWGTPSLAQACFRLTGWHELPEATRRVLLARLLMLPGRGTTIAVAARRTDGRPPVAVDMVVRIADASRELLDSSADLLAFAVAEARVRMERLDGAHGRALVASLPLGGFLPGALGAGAIR